jgi:hypothetical protein
MIQARTYHKICNERFFFFCFFFEKKRIKRTSLHSRCGKVARKKNECIEIDFDPLLVFSLSDPMIRMGLSKREARRIEAGSGEGWGGRQEARIVNRERKTLQTFSFPESRRDGRKHRLQTLSPSHPDRIGVKKGKKNGFSPPLCWRFFSRQKKIKKTDPQKKNARLFFFVCLSICRCIYLFASSR